MSLRRGSHGAGFVGIALGLSASFTWASTAMAQPPPDPAAPDLTIPVTVPNELMQVSAAGVTAEQVGLRAAATSWQARASEEQVRAAAARVDQAWAQFLPRLTATARYTRLSDFTVPSLTSGGSLVGTAAPPGTLNPTPTIALGGLTIPLVLDNFLLQAQVVVPISD